MEDAIVFDNGTGNIKSGYLGENVPRANFKNIVGRPKVKELGMCDTYVAEFVQEGRDNFSFPIVRGIISDFDDIETVWYHNFYNELREDPSEHPVLLTETSWNTQPAREQALKVMFETFQVPSLTFIDQCLCSLTGAGTKTGLVLEFGHGSTQVVPIVDGVHDRVNMTQVSFGGIDLGSFSTNEEKLNAFFTSNQIMKPILQIVITEKGHVVIGGGVSALDGLVARIKEETTQLFPNVQFTHVKSDKPQYSVYEGASQLFEAYPEKESRFVSNDDYQEMGVACLQNLGL